MNNQELLHVWLHTFRKTVDSIVATIPEQNRMTCKMYLLTCKNDILFSFLILPRIPEGDFSNQTHFVTKGDIITPKSSLIRCINNCKADYPYTPQNFQHFTRQYTVFHFNSSQPLHVPNIFSLFFHTLFSSWRTKYYAPLTITHDSSQAVINHWKCFHQLINENSINNPFITSTCYCTKELNLKLFKLLFDVDIELTRNHYNDIFNSFPRTSFLQDITIKSEFDKISEVLTCTKTKIIYPSLQRFVVTNFCNELDKILYTSQDFSSSSSVLIKYKDYKDPTLDNFSAEFHKKIDHITHYFNKQKQKYIYRFKYDDITISLIPSTSEAEKFTNSLHEEFQQTLTSIGESIQNVKNTLYKKRINPTIRSTIYNELDSFLLFINKKWEQSHKMLSRRLKYNLEIYNHSPSSTIRREKSSIKRNADVFYPIDEFFSCISERFDKTTEKIKNSVGKETVQTSKDNKQNQLDVLCYNTFNIIDYCAFLSNSLFLKTADLKCSGDFIYDYLNDCSYFLE